jgi:N-acetylgalactosamine-6-sulfatase
MRSPPLLLFLLLLLSPTATAAEPAPARPNFVLILADDWGWGDLGCYGHRRLRTPNLDRLAAQGILFTNFTQCGSVCSPTRSALLTGRFPAELAMHGHLAMAEQNAARAMPNWLDPALPTLPRALKEAGYATGHFGKWHLGGGPDAPLPDRYGFDAWRISQAGPGAADWELSGPEKRPQSSRLIIDETIGFLRKNAGKPFYVQAWLQDTHATLNPTPEQLKAYQGMVNPGLRYTSAEAVYFAAATDADRHVGRLLAALDELELAANTVVIFTSDNGPEAIEIGNAGHSGVGSPGPFRGRKRSLYEGGIRVPFLVRWPAGTPAGVVDDTSVVSGADLFPTLAALAGASITPGTPLRGEDRSDALRGRPGPRRTPLFWEWRFNIAGHVANRSPMLAVREGNWKLLLNPDRSRVELYDLAADPRERENLARAHPEIVEPLAEKVLAWSRTLPDGPRDPGAGRDDYPWPGRPRGPAARNANAPSASR